MRGGPTPASRPAITGSRTASSAAARAWVIRATAAGYRASSRQLPAIREECTVAVLLGLAVAGAYGAADFLGGLSSKRAPATTVVVVSQLCCLPLLAVLVGAGGGHPSTRAIGLGAAAGSVGAVGLSCLYRGLARGRMSVVAPITAVGAATVPVAWGLIGGERPSPMALAGVLLAMVAVALISRLPAPAPGTGQGQAGDSAIGLAVVAGAAFGTVFVLLDATGPDAGFWPLVAGRTTSIVALVTVAAATGQALAPPAARMLPTIAGAGMLDLSANALYLLATRRGLLSVVAVLSSLYPAGTVLLARTVLGERMAGHQVLGLVLAAAGVALIAAG
ncbi:MAG: DMT family transporter [Actinobacteria bacterium]|nr:DMT family transporter [Actinomycetota bacterium]